MPKGPQGQKRPADTNSAAVMVAKIATEDVQDPLPDHHREAGLKGGPARSEALTQEERAEIARKAAQARWDGAGGGTRTRKA